MQLHSHALSKLQGWQRNMKSELYTNNFGHYFNVSFKPSLLHAVFARETDK